MTTPLIRQTWTMSAVLINMIGQGMVLGYPSSLLPALSQADSPIKVDLHTSSWLGSMVGVSCMLGFPISSVLMALCGRKTAHILVSLPGIFSWFLIYFATDVTTLMVGRFLGGFTSGGTVSLGAIVIGEYTCPKYRGVFLYLKNATVCMGAMFLHIISRYLHWRTIALVGVVPLIIALLIVFTWPESPSWLASKHQYERSEEAFYWLRGNDDAARRELEEIIKTQKAVLTQIKMKSRFSDKIVNFYRKFRQKDFLKPFLITVLASLVLEMSGRHVFPSYALQIMAGITGETNQSFYYTLGVDVMITASALFGSVLVKIMNRRTLFFSTGFSAVLVLMSVCLFPVFTSKGIISGDKIWVPIGLLVVYFILANLGCAPIPLALIGEVFPLAHRGVGSGLSGIFISLCLMGGLKSTPHLLANIGVYGFFLVYGSIMGVSLLILYFILPETKDRTLQEIEYYFKYGKFASPADNDKEANIKMITE